MKRRYAWLLSLVAFAPLAALADSAWVTTPANLRAGPDVGYPSIAVLPAGTEVELYGCVDDWSWCDVETAYDRGWISAGLLDYDWDGQQVDVYDYGPQLSLPIVSFVFGAYWDNYYRGRPWYRQRDHWSNYHPVYHPRPTRRPVPHLPPRQRPPHHADRPQPRPSTPMPARPVQRPHATPSQQHEAPVARPGGHGVATPNRPRPAVQPARPAPHPATPAQPPSPRPIAQRPQPAAKPAPRPVSRPSVQPAPKPVSRPVVQPHPQPAARPAAPKPASRPATPERNHDKDKSDKQRR